MNKVLIIVTIIILVISGLLYKSVSVFETMVNDAKFNPEKFDNLLTEEQQQKINKINKLKQKLKIEEEKILNESSHEKLDDTETKQSNNEFKKILSEETPIQSEISKDANNVESFTNFNKLDGKQIKCPPIVFSSPCAVNMPINEAIPKTFTGGNYSFKQPERKGNYCLPIQKLQYDGIWNNNVEQLNNGYQTNSWSISAQPQVLTNLCTDKFIHIPEEVLIPGTPYYESCGINKVNSEKDYVMKCCY